jgi:hypothetical protein
VLPDLLCDERVHTLRPHNIPSVEGTTHGSDGQRDQSDACEIRALHLGVSDIIIIMPRWPKRSITDLESWKEGELEYLSVEEETRRSYESRLNTMRGYGLPLDYDGLVRLFRLKDGTSADSLGNTRSAVSWHRDCAVPRLPPLSQDELDHLARLLRGRRLAMKASKPKGAIDYAHLTGLVRYMIQRPCPASDVDNVMICWGTALRANQMEKLRRRHFTHVEGVWHLRVAAQHDAHASKTDHQRVNVSPVHPHLNSLLDRLLPELRPEALVCPGWNTARYNRIIKAAAVDLQWDPTLAWKGVHQLRHGVAVDLTARVDSEAARQLLGHAKPRVAKTVTQRVYAIDNEKRRQLHAKKGAKKAESTAPSKPTLRTQSRKANKS